MSLQTRQNPETGLIEVLANGQWVQFDEYRKKQIDDAYQSSVRFLRERLGEDAKQISTNPMDEMDEKDG